jgi:hypothetical protein
MQELWAKPKDDQISFVLHEYCRFLGIDDGQYQVTGRFLGRLRNEKSLDAFRQEARMRLTAIVKAHEENFLSQPLNPETLLRPIELSSDYRICNDPGAPKKRMQEACMGVAQMIQGALSGIGASFAGNSSGDFGANRRIEEYAAFVESLPQGERRRNLAARLGTQTVDGLEHVTQTVRARFGAIGPRIKDKCRGRDQAVACAFAEVRLVLTGEVPKLLTWAQAASEAQLAGELAELSRYYESDRDLSR